MEKQFIYKKTISGRSLYGGVFIDAVEIPVTKNRGELLIINKADKYQYATNFGAEYFFEKYNAVNSSDMIIQVFRVYEMPVDTSPALIVYSMIMALCDVFKFSINDAHIDEEELTLNMRLR